MEHDRISCHSCSFSMTFRDQEMYESCAVQASVERGPVVWCKIGGEWTVGDGCTPIPMKAFSLKWHSQKVLAVTRKEKRRNFDNRKIFCHNFYRHCFLALLLLLFYCYYCYTTVSVIATTVIIISYFIIIIIIIIHYAIDDSSFW